MSSNQPEELNFPAIVEDAIERFRGQDGSDGNDPISFNQSVEQAVAAAVSSDEVAVSFMGELIRHHALPLPDYVKDIYPNGWIELVQQVGALVMQFETWKTHPEMYDEDDRRFGRDPEDRRSASR